MSTLNVLDLVWGVLLIILAIKFFPVIGIFGTLTFAAAGLKIATLYWTEQ